MKTLETTSWQRNGSTLLFGLEQIQELLKKKSMVSLQEFLTWGGDIPDDPPIPEDSPTILVCGLETVMETLSPEEAQNFLRKKVRPVIQNVQNIWTETGIVFCFPSRCFGRSESRDAPSYAGSSVPLPEKGSP